MTAEQAEKKGKGGCAFGILIVVLVAIVGGVLVGGRWFISADAQSQFSSCRNHATFVATALQDHVRRNTWLPYDPKIPGEDLFCRIDFGGQGQNCNKGAPGQSHGGWQMINASVKTWGDILERMPNGIIPVLWCGKPHTPGATVNYGDGPVRIVICLDNTLPGLRSAHQAAISSRPQLGLDTSRFFVIEYGMSDRRLAQLLARVNAYQRSNMEVETVLDIEGRADYWLQAEAFQVMNQRR